MSQPSINAAVPTRGSRRRLWLIVGGVLALWLGAVVWLGDVDEIMETRNVLVERKIG